jgi:hypothetical protein
MSDEIPDRRRQISEEEADLIAEKLWEKAKSELYINAGKGVVNLVWKFCLMGFIALAVYGSIRGWWN